MGQKSSVEILRHREYKTITLLQTQLKCLKQIHGDTRAINGALIKPAGGGSWL